MKIANGLNAWPYRDYLISSFNADKPYARFIQEQIAGDVLYPDDPQATIALGFIAAGPWDESSQMGILDDTTDKKIAQYLDRDDMVQTTICTFNSVTVGCARCHDHKFDPISQEDYYGLQAVFAGVDRADRPYDPDPHVFTARRSLLARKRGLASGRYRRRCLSPGTKHSGAGRAWATAFGSTGTHGPSSIRQSFRLRRRDAHQASRRLSPFRRPSAGQRHLPRSMPSPRLRGLLPSASSC